MTTRREPPAPAYDRGGSGEPLVLLHPLGADRRVWAPVRPLLEAQRDVIAVDLPGFGASPPLGESEPTPQRLAAAVVRLLAALGLGGARAHVAGNSLGGWVALELAAAGQAASATAIAPAGLWPAPLAPKPEVARRIARLALPVMGPAMHSARFRRLALGGSVAEPANVPPQAAATLVRSYATAPGFSAVNRAMRAGVFGSLGEIEVPVTLAWAQYDRLVRRPAGIPAGVREVFLAGCGHVPMWDDPRTVADLLLRGSSVASPLR